MGFNREQERHDELASLLREGLHVLRHLAQGIHRMADIESQALADLTAAVSTIADAVAAEIQALQAALTALQQSGSNPDHTAAIEGVVTRLNELTASLKASLPPAASPPAASEPPPATPTAPAA